MTLAPEGAVSPLQSAPPDRPTTNVEQWARQGIALLFADNVLDMNERRILKDFFLEVAQRGQQGGIGNGGTPSAEAPPSDVAQSPQDMNQNTEPMYNDSDEQNAGAYNE